MKGWLAPFAALLIGPAWAASGDTGDCGTYPPQVLAATYAGWSDCILKQAGEKPLWRGLTLKDARQQIRFTFTEGHGAYTRVIDFDEHADGSGIVRLKTLRRDPEEGLIISSLTTRRISATDVAMIDSLGSSSGTWRYPVGSWDGDQLFMHCETLDMERAAPEGYRFSSVNISCNQPQKLMPFLQFVTGLVDLKPSADGRMY